MAATYSMLDVTAALTGPFASFSLSEKASADEGFVLEMLEDKTELVMGSGPDGFHNLIASNAGRITATYLKTSPVHAKLMALYKTEKALGGIGIGQDTITISNAALGDNHTGVNCAFRRLPIVRYGKNGGMMEWSWNVIDLDMNLGSGLPGGIAAAAAIITGG